MSDPGIKSKARRIPPNVWKPGQSGNPNGRPKLAYDIQALAREHTAAALKALVEALADQRTKVAAAQALLDRGYGRPIQSHDIRHSVAAATADDASLASLAFAGSGPAALPKDDTPRPEGVVH